MTARPTAPVHLSQVIGGTVERHARLIAIEVPPPSPGAAREAWTYADLAERSARLARALVALAACDSAAAPIVAILLPRHDPWLYAAQLAALESGAAFTCLDERFPDAQLAAILADARPSAIVTDGEGARRLRSLGTPLPPLVEPGSFSSPGASPPAGEGPRAPADPDRLAYLIYTSGTSGRPKGVMLAHRGIVNLVLSDLDAFGLGPGDRVAQCSSPAYDSSIEEAWLALASGATLVLLDDSTLRLGPDLVAWLRREHITVFCPPPTLLRATGCRDPASELPDLRLLYVGGEALPQDLADRWSRGRRMVNGYGPTECTVTVTRGEVRPGERVTIGRPVRGHEAYILDEALAELPEGEVGELCIAGPGLALGYLAQPEHSASRFPIHPRLGRLYRTGDLARREPSGDLVHLGRIDGQVKLRGYRVELGAVEAALATQPGVREAACRLQDGAGGGQLLACHVVADGKDAPPDPEALRAALRGLLPEYMVPARLGLLPRLPTGVGGKLDRRALPDIPAPRATAEAGDHAGGAEPPPSSSPLEARLAAAFAEALELGPGAGIRPEADFFLDLGGDSLSAVAVVCALRDDPTAPAQAAAIAVRDLYEARSVAGLARRVAGEGAADLRDDPWPQPPVLHDLGAEGDRARPALCTAVQGAWLLGELVIGSAALGWLALRAPPAWVGRLGPAAALASAPVLGAAAVLAYGALTLAWTALLKRLLIGRYRPLRAPIWGGYYLRHWLVAHSARHVPWRLVAGTGLASAALRALGARVGPGVHIHRGVDLTRGGWDLLDLGAGATLGQDASPRLVELGAGDIVVGPVAIGAGASVAVRGSLSPGASLGRGAHLAALSWLPGGAAVPPGQAWDGVPARPAGPAPSAPTVDRAGDLAPAARDALLVAGRLAQDYLGYAVALVLLGLVGRSRPELLARAAAWLADPLDASRPGWALLALPPAALALGLLLQALALRALGPIASGAYSDLSPQALRIWLKTGAVDAAGRHLSGSMLWPSWLRLAGMRIGRGAEVSTIIDSVPEAVAIGPESFFADGIYLGGPERRARTVRLAPTTLGRGTFLGNHAVVPAGAYPDDYFVGVATVADATRARSGTAWFGRPALELPRRERVALDRRLTHEPDLPRVVTRAFWELLRLFLPLGPLAAGLLWYALAVRADAALGGAMLVLALSAIVGACAALLVGATLAVKWLVLGRVRPGRHAFWSGWCGRWDFVYMAWGAWAGPVLRALEGTLFLNAVLRLTGMRIGRGVALGAGFAQVVDPDMLAFGDGATVACQFQAHTFEDRVLKIDRLRIGPGASVGPNTVLFYGADIGAGARVAPDGVVMKREQLAAGRSYAGSPAREVRIGANAAPARRAAARGARPRP